METLKNLAYVLVSTLWRPHNAAVILMYHSVSDEPGYSTITPVQFSVQMKLLHDENFNVVSLDKLAEYRNQKNIPAKTVCVTFDDGYMDNYTNAYPVLKQYNFPATIFVISSILNAEWQTKMNINPNAMLGESELKEMYISGLISVESHTVTHPKLPKIPFEKMVQEIQDSKNVLEQKIGVVCAHFAYPFGRYSDVTVSAVSRAGIVYAYTVESGLVRPGSNSLLLPRNGMNRTLSLAQFRGIVRCGRLSRQRFFGSSQ